MQINTGNLGFLLRLCSLPGGLVGKKNPPAMQEMQETRVRSLSQEGPLEEDIATRSRTLAWRTPRTEGPGGLQPMGSQSWAWLRTEHTLRVFLNVGLAAPLNPLCGGWQIRCRARSQSPDAQIPALGRSRCRSSLESSDIMASQTFSFEVSTCLSSLFDWWLHDGNYRDLDV